MDFKLQAFGPFLHWLSLVALCVMPLLAAYAIYRLGSLPGEIARSRRHPQADAIAICGWMGIVTLVLWPVAMVWAYGTPKKIANAAFGDDIERATLLRQLREARQQLHDLSGRVPPPGAPAGS